MSASSNSNMFAAPKLNAQTSLNQDCAPYGMGASADTSLWGKAQP